MEFVCTSWSAHIPTGEITCNVTEQDGSVGGGECEGDIEQSIEGKSVLRYLSH